MTWQKCVKSTQRMLKGHGAGSRPGIAVWIAARARIAHEKALIIDRRVTIIGSCNFSAGAAWNSEGMKRHPVTGNR